MRKQKVKEKKRKIQAKKRGRKLEAEKDIKWKKWREKWREKKDL